MLMPVIISESGRGLFIYKHCDKQSAYLNSRHLTNITQSNSPVRAELLNYNQMKRLGMRSERCIYP